MRVGILHNSLNVQGGSERFTVDLIKVLKDRGHEVHLATFDKVDWNSVEENMGSYVKPDKCFSILPWRPRIFGIYHRIFLMLAVKWLAQGADVTINAHSDHLFCKTDIVYIHWVSATQGTNLNFQYPWWKAPYVFPYRIILWINSKVAKGDSMFLANSHYTKEKLFAYHGIHADRVIYPPVHTEVYRKLLCQSKRENIVLTIGRYSPERELGCIIEIAKRTQSYIRFVVIGQAAKPSELAMANSLIGNARMIGLPIEFHVNVSQDFKREMISKAKVVLQPSHVEHFGIGLCEAISGGCLPVAVNEGGHLEVLDLLDGSTAYRYENFSEAAGQIEKAIESWNPQLSEFASRQMERFSLERFGHEIMNILTEFGKNVV